MNPQIVGKYKCRLCQFSSDRKHNYISHLKSKKHKKNQQEQQISIPAPMPANAPVPAAPQNLDLASAYSELTDEVNRMRNELNNFKVMYTELSTLKRQVETLRNALKDTTPVPEPMVAKNDMDIILKAFGHENWNYMDDNIVLNLMKKVNVCLPELVKIIHFNLEHPENMNIQITNKKENTIKIYDGREWKTQQRNDTIDNLILNLINQLENYEENFKKNTSPYIFELWRKKKLELISDSENSSKILKNMRTKIICCIVDMTKTIKSARKTKK
uniref:Uncharacterized protein n=1 Tax=viral metagenome TaxID=1070528 RepID=A0A6C0AVQ9_9ZZZZ|tara:strand:+ start:18329 stop:19147 length:819 start_codon:yes stop_codon:yes gene_type:complete